MAILRILALGAVLTAIGLSASAETPRIDSVELLDPQPHKADDAVIWYDAFDEPSSQYFEQKGPLTDKQAFGGKGKSLEIFYPKGKGGGGSGNRKLAIGDTPVGGGKALKKGNKFQDVYWRMYVKHQKGWKGNGPAKMSRATIFNANNWSQAMISHVWGSGPKLSLDPVRAANGTSATTTKYNDWNGLKWLGNAPGSKFKLHATEEAGRWVCVEARAKLNTPGKKDGYNCLWLDGIKQTERKNLDFRSSYTKYGINAILIEAYWNKGSPVDQYRWYDDLVVSTKPIGPAYTGLNPVLIRTGSKGELEIEVAVRTKDGAVEVDKAVDCGNQWNPIIGEDVKAEVVWKSKAASGPKFKVDGASGAFTGSRAGKSSLEPGKQHFCRVRPKGGAWSTWHQSFQTAELDEPEAPPGAMKIPAAKANVAAAPAAVGSSARGEREAGRVYQMARNAERMGQKDVARMLYAQVVEKHPGTEAASKAKKRVK